MQVIKLSLKIGLHSRVKKGCQWTEDSVLQRMYVSCQWNKPSLVSWGINFSDVKYYFKKQKKHSMLYGWAARKPDFESLTASDLSQHMTHSIDFQPCSLFTKADERLVKAVQAHSCSQRNVTCLYCADIRITGPAINSSFSWKQKGMLAKKWATVGKSCLVRDNQRAGCAGPSSEKWAMHSHGLEMPEMIFWEHLPAACAERVHRTHRARHTQVKEEMQQLKKMMGGRQQKGVVVNATGHLFPLPAKWKTSAPTDTLQLLSLCCFAVWSHSGFEAFHQALQHERFAFFTGFKYYLGSRRTESWGVSYKKEKI